MQTLLVDDVGVGIEATHRRLANHRARGQWVWILDDDDEAVYDNLVHDIHAISLAQPETQVIMVKMDHGDPLGVLPDALVWRQTPVEGHLGSASFIVRRDVWNAHRSAWSARYAGDYDFIADVFAAQPVVFWHDVIASRCQRGRSLGAGE